MITKKLTFEVQKADIVDDSNEQFALARVHAFSSGPNLHEMTCDVETLKRTAPTLFEKPLVFDFEPAWQDFGSHVDEPFIAGFVVPDSAEFFEVDDGSGRTGLSVIVKIWRYYSKNFIDIFKREQTDTKKVSVEMELRETEPDKESGLTRMLDWCYTAICVLGSFVSEASPGAHMQIIQFAEKEDKESYFKEFAKYESIDFFIPKSVKSNSKKGLELRENLGRGGTNHTIALANYILKNEKADPDKVRSIYKQTYNRSARDFEDKESNEWISYLLVGGNAGRKWSANLHMEMDECDQNTPVYFQNGDFPDSDVKESEIEGKEEITLMAKEKKDEILEVEEIQTETFAEEEKPEEEKEDGETYMADEEKPEEKPEEEDKEEMAAEESEDDAEEKEDEEGEESEESEEDMAVYELMGRAMPMMSEEISAKYAAKEVEMSVVFEALLAKAEGMAEEMGNFSAELEELRAFKSNIEMQKFNFEVDSTLKDAEEFLPEDEYTALKEDSANFSLADIEQWKNKVRAKAFELSKGKKEKKEPDYVVYALPFVGKSRENDDSLWVGK